MNELPQGRRGQLDHQFRWNRGRGTTERQRSWCSADRCSVKRLACGTGARRNRVHKVDEASGSMRGERAEMDLPVARPPETPAGRADGLTRTLPPISLVADPQSVCRAVPTSVACLGTRLAGRILARAGDWEDVHGASAAHTQEPISQEVSQRGNRSMSHAMVRSVDHAAGGIVHRSPGRAAAQFAPGCCAHSRNNDEQGQATGGTLEKLGACPIAILLARTRLISSDRHCPRRAIVRSRR